MDISVFRNRRLLSASCSLYFTFCLKNEFYALSVVLMEFIKPLTKFEKPKARYCSLTHICMVPSLWDIGKQAYSLGLFFVEK